MPTRIYWRLILTFCPQASRAPIVDHATTEDAEGRQYSSRAILPPRFWRVPKSERPAATCLVVGWRRHA